MVGPSAVCSVRGDDWMPHSWDDRHHWESKKRHRGRSRRRGRQRRELSREEQALREARQRADRKLAFIRHFVC